MANIDIQIIPSRLSGTLDAISSKSFAHRLLICAALADDITRIRINGLSDDIDATIRCLKAMSCKINIEFDKNNGIAETIIVEPLKKLLEPSLVLQCGESGATARFLLPLAAHLFGTFTMTGEGRLPNRPFTPLCKALTNAGCSFDSDKLPMAGKGKLQAGDFHIEGNISSQFISGLLFVLPLLNGDSRILLTTPLESAPYVDMTIEVLNLFGIKIERSKDGFTVKGNQSYKSPHETRAEGDWSNAAFFLCIGALSSAITMRGLSPNSTQGDK